LFQSITIGEFGETLSSRQPDSSRDTQNLQCRFAGNGSREQRTVRTELTVLTGRAASAAAALATPIAKRDGRLYSV